MTTLRKNIMLGTAGHVDHGKTALVKLLTGCETDTLAEEKARGLTIDLGFAPCRLADDRVVGIVDVPGHVDFIRNMVAGAHGVDVVMLVVAADDGIMPQTHEHLHILTLMGLRHGLVVLTKIDLVDEARRQFMLGDLRRLLAGTFLSEAPICPISNITGEGFDQFFDALNQVVAACEDRSSSGLFRMWVEDVFTIRGSGTVITGIPSNGRVGIDDTLHLTPPGLSGHVRRMQVYGQEATEAKAGECVALNLPELDHLQVRRGMVLCGSKALAPVSMAEGELRLLNSIKDGIDDFIQVHLHVGTASVLARIAMLAVTGMTAGQVQMVQLRLDEPLPLTPGERFVVRANLSTQAQSGLVTVGGGRIVGTSNTRLRRKKQWTIDSLRARRDALDSPYRWCEVMVQESATPLLPRELETKCLLRPEQLKSILDQLRIEGKLLQSPNGGLIHKFTVDQAAAKMLAAVQAFHAANPQRSGLSPDELYSASTVSREVGDLALEILIQTKQLERAGAVFARRGWKAKVSDREQNLSDQVSDAFKAAGWAGPTADELAAKLRQPADRIQRAMQSLAERGTLVRLDQRLFIHQEALESAKQVVLRLFAKKPSFTTMDFRDAVSVSRKYAVPLLDYLDKIRFTVRSGHDRTPGAEARRLLRPA